MRSSVFRAMLVGSSREAEMGTIHIDDLDSLTVNTMLQFMYTDTISKIGITIDLLAAADKYDIGSLYQKCICG